MASSSTTYNSPCAACKFLRRKCLPGCIFAPYFPPEEPQKFANVHKIFGASNVTKLLNDLLPHQREDAVNSLAYEAEARVRDPVYGCVGAISFLQRQVERLQKELDAANADLFRIACDEIAHANTIQPTNLMNTRRQHHVEGNRRFGIDHFGGGNDIGHGNNMGFYQTPSFGYAYSLPWGDSYNNNPNGSGMGGNL